VKKNSRYFLLNPILKRISKRKFYYAGIYLGKVKNKKFFPSFNLIMMLAESKANRIVVEKKSAWLFICGRDIFQKGIISTCGSYEKGNHVLVMNEYGDCLGFGRIVSSLNRNMKREVAVKNVSDIGDFLRREK
jgi:ribosome biogenesis protein Nip4